MTKQEFTSEIENALGVDVDPAYAPTDGVLYCVLMLGGRTTRVDWFHKSGWRVVKYHREGSIIGRGATLQEAVIAQELAEVQAK